MIDSLAESFTIKYEGSGQLIVQDVFDSKAKAEIKSGPKTTRIKSGESVTFFLGHPGITRKIKIFPFAP